MPKIVKGNSARKAPEPAADHAVVEQWFGRIMPGMRPLAEAIDAAIRDELPAAHVAVKFHHVFYGLPELGWIIELAAYHVSVNVLFHGGADFASPPPLGDTDRTRYVKITELDDQTVIRLLDWIAQAGRTPGWV